MTCSRLYNTTKYRLPDELDSVFIKSLLHRIRADLHAKGYLESATASLTRCAWTASGITDASVVARNGDVVPILSSVLDSWEL